MRSTCSEEKATSSPVLSENYFRSAITRERKRAGRAGLAVVALFVCKEDSDRSLAPAEVWHKVEEALQAVRSDIDMLGWFEQGISMGLLVPDLNPSDLASACERLERSVRNALTDRLENHAYSGLSIRLRVHPESMRSEEEAFQSIDPYLYPELHSGKQSGMGFELAKRTLDVVASLLLLLALSPLLAVIALLVKLTSPGPVIFRQVRIGRMMKPFMIYKFRSMRTNTDHGIHHNYVSWFITSSDKAQGQDKHQVFKLTSDPRITPIGHFIRKTSLDEFPQLWNVLKGEMSLVGPRPPLWYELQQYKPWHRHRVLEAKPGITGLWQVSGRSRTTFDEMVRLDLRYVKAKSLWTDIKILLATPRAVISGKGAC